MRSLRAMSWPAYGALVIDLFRRDGYNIFLIGEEEQSAGDLWAERGAERVLVQYRLRGFEDVPAEAVQELGLAAHRFGAQGAWQFCDGTFSPEAVSAALDYNVTLVDGMTLAELVIEITINEVREQQASRRLFRRLAALVGGSRNQAA